MIQSKAIDILRSLSRKEFLQFGRQVESASQGSNKNLFKLYKFLKKYYPAFDSDKLTKENLHKAVYGNARYSDPSTRKLLSEIYKEAEKFIVIQNVFASKTIYDKVLLSEFDTRKLDNLFLSRYEELNNYLDSGEKHYEYFLDKFLTEWVHIAFHHERGQQHKIAMNIYKRTEYLIFLFLSDLFLSLNDIQSNKIAYNISSDINLAQAFIESFDDKKFFEYIEKNRFENKDVLYIYYLGYLALKNFENEEYYYKLRDFAFKNIDKFHEASQKATVIFLANYCTRKLKKQDSEKFRLELNRNYNLYIKYKLYKMTGENYIRSDLFLNILTNYFDVGKTKEVVRFLKDNIENIQPSHRKNMLAVSNALIEFENGNYGESLRNASMIKSNTFLYKDKIKILTLKNNYELKNFEIAKELSNSYRIFLTENRNIPDLQKEKSLKFLGYYNSLWKIYDGKPGKINIKDMKDEISKDPNFTESVWILEKVKELIN
ncbi:MAG: hypothetical protein HOP31_14065 [Ignavibacteria bacterium]|nr:hypothetical protein [Ignavibacteria bacterium]